MGVILGTLTTKEGRVIPLPTAADELQTDEVEVERRKEELKFSRRIHNVTSSTLWGRDVPRNGDVIVYDRYRTITEDLKRKGETMKKDVFATKQFKIFRALFTNPNVALNTKRLSELTGVKTNSISILLKKPIPFLLDEGLVEERSDPRSPRFKVYVFKAKCDDAEAEAKLWYEKMLNSTHKKPAARTPSKSQPQAAAPRAPVPVSQMAQVQVDTETMEAIIRVPLDKLALVLKVIS